MIDINKGPQCEVLRQWKQLNVTSPQNIHYDNLGKEERGPMLMQLIKEQGGLCAYTMKSLILSDGIFLAHIEHILPRSLHPGESVDWPNLVACFPQPDVSCDYGAKRKDNYDPFYKPFVNPVRAGAAAQFRFRENGEVEGLTPAAKKCVDAKVLNLNHANLVNDRRGKIQGALRKRPSAAAALRRAQALRQVDMSGRLEPYCEAVAQVLEDYALRLQQAKRGIAGAKQT